MRACLIPAAIVMFTSAALGATSPVGPTEADLNAAVQPLREKLAQIEELKEASPEKYIVASLAWAEDLAKIAERFRTVSQSTGVRGDAVSRMMKTADFVRLRMREPRRAITIYTRAAAVNTMQFPLAASVGMHEKLADIYEYDLGDHATAAKTLRVLRMEIQQLPQPNQSDYAAWNRWTLRWLDAEIAFLEDGRHYTDTVTAHDLTGFAQTLFFGAGHEATNSENLGHDFNIYDEVRPLTPVVRKKLLDLPASHSMFLRTWMFAARLTDVDDARRWLDRNDKGGFWRACLISLAAIGDQAASAGKVAKSEGVLSLLSRTPDGKPTGFALLGREFAKRHSLPQLPE